MLVIAIKLIITALIIAEVFCIKNAEIKKVLLTIECILITITFLMTYMILDFVLLVLVWLLCIGTIVFDK